MQKELKLLQQQLGITFLFVTHDQEEAMAMSDRIVLLYKGRVEQCAPPREIYLTPRTEYAASFIGKSNLVRGEVANGVATCGQFRLAAEGPDGSVVFSLRPECVRLATNDEPNGTLQFEAVMEVVQFQGASTLVSLRTMDGVGLNARLPASLLPPVGSRVRFACDPRDFVRLEIQ